ncbi:MAG: hypothetical protein Q8M09_12475 [Pseudomonadota bacterium]|nr:hypothetical protein [Pseudomonadota bacterium]MDP1905042.1 hypothetical protein [Pseudomonadota bacterium]MDP2354283.1 hypothetical protein [Pseudomonadota bacterium]
MALHPDFKAANWRGTTSSNGEIIGISFDLEDGSVVRLKLDAHSACQAGGSLIEELAKGGYRALMNSQSAKSSGNPDVEGSIPDEGVNV